MNAPPRNEAARRALEDAHPGQKSAIQRRQNITKPAVPCKFVRILAALYSGRSLNRFQAEGLSDHCLHSTVSTLQEKGVLILRRNESVRGFMGCPTTVCRYSISREPENLRRAYDLLAEHGALPEGAIRPAIADRAGSIPQAALALDHAVGQP